MPQSLSAWWKSRFHLNKTRLSIVNVGQDVDDKKVAVAITSAEVGHIAARCIFEHVKVLDGYPTFEATILTGLECLSGSARKIAEKAITVSRLIAGDAKLHTEADLPAVFIDLEPVITAVFDLCHDVDERIRKAFDAQRDRAKRGPNSLALILAAEKTMSDLNHAIAYAIKAHIASIANPTTMSVPPLEKLVMALADTAAESMRAVVNTVMVLRKSSPPSYESLGY